MQEQIAERVADIRKRLTERTAMARAPTGSVRHTRRQERPHVSASLRAYGQRRYITTEAQSHQEAEQELRHVLADVERGVWRPAVSVPVSEAPVEEPIFWDFARDWLERREHEVESAPSNTGNGRSTATCATSSVESCSLNHRRDGR
jgi:hypothetical protein